MPVEEPDHGQRRLHVLLVATSFVRTSGGGRTFLAGLAGGLSATDEVRVTIAAPLEHVPDSLKSAGHRIVDVGAPPGALRLMADAFVSLRAQRWGVDVVHYPHEWCPPSPRPVVLTAQNIRPFHPRTAGTSGARGTALRGLSRMTAHRASAVVAVSRTAAEAWNRFVPVAQVSDIIPEGFTAPAGDLASQVKASEAQGLRFKPDYILAVTGGAEYKNASLTIETMRRHTSRNRLARWVVAGVPPGRWHDGQRRFGVGHVERDHLLRLMASARAVVFLSEVESFGLPALEALAMGSRPIVLKGTAMAEWFGNVSSVVVPDPPAIVAAIESAYNFPRKQKDTGQKLALDFDWGTIARRYVNVYRRVVRSCGERT